MKVTFIIPPVLDATSDVDRCFGCNYNIYFLPLLPALYAATIVRDEGISVSVLDFAAQKKTADDFRRFIQGDNSDIYVFYTVFLSKKTDSLARGLIRQERPGRQFIFFGPQPTYAPEEFLDREDTFVVRGEPEFTIQALMRGLKAGSDVSGIKGVSSRKNGQAVNNPPAELIQDIDSIPIPDRTLLDHSPYCNPKLSSLPHTATLTSRGCFGQCWFCVPNSLSYARELEHKRYFGRKPVPRLHSAQRVIEEFRSIAAAGFRSVSVIDDEFLWDEARTQEICEGIKGLGIEWSCLCRPEKITEAVAGAMSRAGCAYVDLGTESFDEEVLKDIRKQMRPEDTHRAVRVLKEAGIEIELNILFAATPKETRGSIEKTLSEVKRLDVDYVLFSIANPFPGTDFYYAAKSQGWMVHGDYVPADPARDSIISYPHLSKEELEAYLLRAYRSFYLNPRYLWRQLFKIRGFADFKNKLKTFFNLLKRNFLNS